jgi:threonine dehydratase
VQETRLDTARIRAARRVIDPVFQDTPLYRCEALEPALGCAVSIKLETANPVRSFKGRGTELVTSPLAESGARAVVCASAGNLGQALAWSGRGRGLDVTVVASRFAPAAKLDRIRALGARLELVDGDFDTARERAAAIARHDGFADDAVLVQEESIIAGLRMLLDHAGLVVEPSAALGIAAILEDRDRFAGRHVATIVCGSNVDMDAYHRWIGAAPGRSDLTDTMFIRLLRPVLRWPRLPGRHRRQRSC